MATTIAIAYNSTWSYKDDGGAYYSNGFYNTSYDYSAWATGSAMFGAGALDSLPAGESVRTTIANPAGTVRSYAFRRTFSCSNASLVHQITLRAVCDDGCVIWINGTEVGSVAKPTTMGDNVDAASLGGNEGTPQVITITGAALSCLTTGTNHIAIFGMDYGASSTDIAFGLQVELVDTAIAGASTISFECGSATLTTGASSPMVFFPTHLAMTMLGGGASEIGALTQIEGSASVTVSGGSAALTIPSLFTEHTYRQYSATLDAGTDKSGCAYDPDEDLLYCIRNTNHLRILTLDGAAYRADVALGNGIDDAEAICRIAGHSSGREWACVSEGDVTPGTVKIHLFDFAKDDSAISNVLTYDFTGIIGAVNSYGAEGLAWDSVSDKFYIVTQQISSGGFWECTIGASPSATRLFTWADSLVAGGAASSNGYVSDLHSLSVAGRDSWCVIVNDDPLASGTTRLAEFTRNGVVLGTLAIATGQTEGFTFLPNAPHDLYIVGEQTSTANFWRWSTECQLVGAASVTATAGSAALDVAVAISGSASIAVTGGSAEISTGASMAGTASVTVSAGGATLLVAVAIAGSSEVVVLGGSAAIDITTVGGVPMLFFFSHLVIAACGGGATAGTYTIPIAVIAMSYED